MLSLDLTKKILVKCGGASGGGEGFYVTTWDVIISAHLHWRTPSQGRGSSPSQSPQTAWLQKGRTERENHEFNYIEKTGRGGKKLIHGHEQEPRGIKMDLCVGEGVMQALHDEANQTSISTAQKMECFFVCVFLIADTSWDSFCYMWKRWESKQRWREGSLLLFWSRFLQSKLWGEKQGNEKLNHRQILLNVKSCDYAAQYSRLSDLSKTKEEKNVDA